MIASGSNMLAEDEGKDATDMLPPDSNDVRREVLVSRIKAMIEDGMSYRAVAAKLNAEGEPTLSGRGQWQGGSIKNLVG